MGNNNEFKPRLAGIYCGNYRESECIKQKERELPELSVKHIKEAVDLLTPNQNERINFFLVNILMYLDNEQKKVLAKNLLVRMPKSEAVELFNSLIWENEQHHGTRDKTNNKYKNKG